MRLFLALFVILCSLSFIVCLPPRASSFRQWQKWLAAEREQEAQLNGARAAAGNEGMPETPQMRLAEMEMNSMHEHELDSSSLPALPSTLQGRDCKAQQPLACNTNSPVVVSLSISIGGSRRGAITLELFQKTAPKTVENFKTICQKGVGGLNFNGNPFHRIIQGFMAQGGDITTQDGRGGRSIYGEKFKDETFACKHVCRGGVSMANAGKDTNGSQFFVTFAGTPWLDGHHVVFGQMVAGWSVLEEMERFGSESGKPLANIEIENCQVLGIGQ